MKNEAIYKILYLPEYCNRNRITRRDDDKLRFEFGWALKIVKFFKDEPAANSITFPAYLYLNGHSYRGEIEIYRNGHHAVRRIY